MNEVHAYYRPTGRRPILSTFFLAIFKAKTSKGHFQSQIDHSTQGKPLKKASRRPREQNASLCSGRVHTQDWLWSTAWPQQMASQNEKEGLRPHKEFPAVSGGSRGGGGRGDHPPPPLTCPDTENLKCA